MIVSEGAREERERRELFSGAWSAKEASRQYRLEMRIQ